MARFSKSLFIFHILIVVEHEGDMWMIPESCRDYSVRLYRAENFPDKWIHTDTLLQGYCYCDNTIFLQGNTWWMFSSIGNDHLNLYYAPTLKGPWESHASNPVVRTGARDCRMGGSIIHTKGDKIRIAQDCVEKYGHFLRGYTITELSADHYQEQELSDSPILQPKSGNWKNQGCHHLDQAPFRGKWIIVSDGY